MASMNMAILIGHLGQDPKVNVTQSGKAVANLSVATSTRVKGADGQYADKTEWHRVTAWDKTAEYCRGYLHKGSCVSVEGRIETRKYQDKDGVDRYQTEIIANRVQGLDRKGAEDAQMTHAPTPHHPGKQNTTNQRAPFDAAESGDIPF